MFVTDGATEHTAFDFDDEMFTIDIANADDLLAFIDLSKDIPLHVDFDFVGMHSVVGLTGKFYGTPMESNELYGILAAMAGCDFLKVYFDNVFPYSQEAAEIEEGIYEYADLLELQVIESTKKDGSLDKRRKLYKRLSKVGQSEWLRNNYSDWLELQSQRVQQALIDTMYQGALPVGQEPLAESTIKKRGYMGFTDPLVRNYASGQLIQDNLKVHLVLGE
jgi:hypothetical protein